MRLAVALASLVLLHAPLASSNNDAPEFPTEVRTEGGVVRGVIEQHSVVYRGIPYAQPPIGAWRWRAPQPVARWQGVRDASRLSPDCMQAPFGLTPPGGRHPVAEDCLYLNIWRPLERARKLPVMVWIHGGGFVNGGSSSPDSTGEGVAKRGVLFVSFNYRLGRFGFFGFPALSEEQPQESKGNYALLDQIAALEWVRRNIENFGGDSRNVTVVGESAGGISINLLLTAPHAKGLFERAIVQSGGGRGLVRPRHLAHDWPQAPSAHTLGLRFAKAKGIHGTDATALRQLRALSAEQVTSGLNMVSLLVPDVAMFSGPVIDDRLIVETPEEAYAAGRQHPVPLIVGATSADLSLQMANTVEDALAVFGANAVEARIAYGPEVASDLKRLNNAIGADISMVEPARFVARSMRRLAQPVYAYRFDYVLQAKRLESPNGAQHATDVPYAFDVLGAVHGNAVTSADARVAAAMCDFWTAFAKSGIPQASGYPAWPIYETATDEIAEFASDGRVTVRPDPWRARLDLVERLHGN